MILAKDALNADGTYDETKSKREGVRILYMSDRGISSDSIQGHECTLMKTEPCFARQQSVNCTITDDKNEASCEFAGCSQQGYKTVTRKIAQHAFGDGTCPPFETTYTTNDGCTIAQRCCESTEYDKSGVCTTGGVQAYTLNTNDCNNTKFDGPSQPTTKTEKCCFAEQWVAGQCNVDNRPGYKKYTRTISNPELCDPAKEDVKYERDTSCDKDCVIGTLTYSDSTRTHGTKGATLRLQGVKYSGTVSAAEGLGSNWCQSWENATGLGGGTVKEFHASSWLVPQGWSETDKARVINGLDLNGSNYFVCGSIVYGTGKDGTNCGVGNPAPW
jgi:hypothetical protein